MFFSHLHRVSQSPAVLISSGDKIFFPGAGMGASVGTDGVECSKYLGFFCSLGVCRAPIVP